VHFALIPAFELITPIDVPPEKNSQMTLTVIEFFTHCCINCIHSIEDVNSCFQKLRSTCNLDSCQLSLLSVHSPKFPREKDKQSIVNFCQKMKMTDHLVINDPNCTLWNNWGIICWPTLIVLCGPPIVFKGESLLTDQNVLFVLMGEGQGENLDFLLRSTLDHLNGSEPKNINDLMLPVSRDTKLNLGKGSVVQKILLLNYPGKFSFFPFVP